MWGSIACFVLEVMLVGVIVVEKFVWLCPGLDVEV